MTFASPCIYIYRMDAEKVKNCRIASPCMCMQNKRLKWVRFIAYFNSDSVYLNFLVKHYISRTKIQSCLEE